MIAALAVLLCLALLLYLAVGRLLRQERVSVGLHGGRIIAADDSRLRSPTLRSSRLGLVGRPDHLLQFDRVVIPVEQKPHARRVQPSHVMQVAAQCALVQEAYSVRPPYGLLVLAGGVQKRIHFTPALEQQLVHTMAEMRALLANDVEPGPTWVAPKCHACGFHDTCWE